VSLLFVAVVVVVVVMKSLSKVRIRRIALDGTIGLLGLLSNWVDFAVYGRIGFLKGRTLGISEAIRWWRNTFCRTP